MLVLRHLEQVGKRFTRPFVTLGNFDGVHRGHQEILHRLVSSARAAAGTAIAITFHPHPAAILSPDKLPATITPLRPKLELIAASGVDCVVVQPFTRDFADLSAEDFVSRLLLDGMGVVGVVVGHRVSFGHNRRGNAARLTAFGERYGFSVEIVGPVEVDGKAVSSSAVRHQIQAGHLDEARQLLGRWPAIYGRVGHGRERGKKLGVPTANVPVTGLATPPDGVYATWTRVGGELLASVANLGTNPTFGDQERHLEVHLLDRQMDLYGQRVEVQLLARLRAEMKFPSPQELVQQIQRDVAAARAVLAAHPCT